MPEPPNEPAQAVVMAVTIIALLFGIVQIGTGTLFGVFPLLIGIIGLIYLDSGGERVAEWIDQRDSTTAGTAQEKSTAGALEALRERYARGEIEQGEFERRLDELLETETLADAADHHNEEPLTERSR